MSPVSVPPFVSSPGILDVDLESYEKRVKILLADQPETLLSPIETLPPKNSTEEKKLSRGLCLELTGHEEIVRLFVFECNNDHEMVPMIAFSVFLCPLDLALAVSLLNSLMQRTLDNFIVWCLSWLFTSDCIASGLSTEQWKQLAVDNLSCSPYEEVYWLDLFITVFGDIPELWTRVASHINSVRGRSDFSEDVDMHTSISDYQSFPTQQTSPPSMLVPSSPPTMYTGVGSSSQPLSAVVNPFSPYQAGAGSSNFTTHPQGPDSLMGEAYDAIDSFPTFPPEMLSDLVDAGYGGSFGSSHSVPHLPLPNGTWSAYRGDIGSFHSLPNFSFEDTSQAIPTDGLDGAWLGSDPSSGPHTSAYNDLRRDPQPSNLTAGVEGAPAGLAPQATLSILHGTTPFLGNSVSSNATLPSVVNLPDLDSHNVRPELGSASGGPRTYAPSESRSPSVQDLIALELVKVQTIGGRIRLIQLRNKRLEYFMRMISNKMKLFHVGSNRVLEGDHLRIPLTKEYRETLLKVIKHLGEVLVHKYVDWKEDMDIGVRRV